MVRVQVRERTRWGPGSGPRLDVGGDGRTATTTTTTTTSTSPATARTTTATQGRRCGSNGAEYGMRVWGGGQTEVHALEKIVGDTDAGGVVRVGVGGGGGGGGLGFSGRFCPFYVILVTRADNTRIVAVKTSRLM